MTFQWLHIYTSVTSSRDRRRRRAQPFSRGQQRGCRQNGRGLLPHQAAPPSARGSLRLHEPSHAQTPSVSPNFPLFVSRPISHCHESTTRRAGLPNGRPPIPSHRKTHITLPFRRAGSGKTSIPLEMQLSRLRTQLARPMRSLPSSTDGQARLHLPARPCRRVPVARPMHRHSASERVPFNFQVVERRTKPSPEVRISQVLNAQSPRWRRHVQTLPTSLSEWCVRLAGWHDKCRQSASTKSCTAKS